MAIIISNQDEIVIDSIITKKGRELLLNGIDNFKITKFAVSDDEINYDLWDASVDDESAGLAIEATPIREANIDGNSALKHKLLSYDSPDTIQMAQITNINVSSISLESGNTYILTPNTIPALDEIYTCYVSDPTMAWVEVTNTGNITSIKSNTKDVIKSNDRSNGDVNKSTTSNISKPSSIRGSQFVVTAKSLPDDKSGTVVIVGENTGATYSIAITVKGINSSGSNL